MELTSCINFLLTTTQHEVFLRFMGKLAPYDITPGQYGVLSCLWSGNGSATPSSIAKTLRLEMPTVSGVLDRMQDKGLLVRTVNPENRRNITVAITERGRALEQPVRTIVDELNAEVLSNFSENEAATLIAGLQKLLEK